MIFFSFIIHLQVGSHNFHGELLGMCNGPVAFWIQQGIKIRMGLVQQLLGAEAVKAQEPVRLIQAMLPQKRRLRVQRWQERIFHHGDIGGIEHPF